MQAAVFSRSDSRYIQGIVMHEIYAYKFLLSEFNFSVKVWLVMCDHCKCIRYRSDLLIYHFDLRKLKSAFGVCHIPLLFDLSFP